MIPARCVIGLIGGALLLAAWLVFVTLFTIQDFGAQLFAR